MFKTKVPLKDSIVRSFIISRFGNGNDVIKIDRRSFLGKAVELGCSKIGYLHSLPRQNDTILKESEFVTLVMPDALKSDFLQPAKIKLLSALLSRYYSENFLSEIGILVEGGLSDYDAVKQYMEKYQIDYEGKVDEKLRKKWRDHQGALRKKFRECSKN